MDRLNPNPDDVVDRLPEREVFRSMFQPGSPLRVMQLAIPSGSGKSWLVKLFVEFCRYGEVPAKAVLIDFGTVVENFTALHAAVRIQEALEVHAPNAFKPFKRLHEAYRIERRAAFPNLLDEPAVQHLSVRVDVKDVTGRGHSIIGYQDNRTIANDNRPFSPDERDVAGEHCLEEFSRDFCRLAAAMDVLVVVDTWEKASPDLKQWVCRQFVRDAIAAAPGGPHGSRVRLVLAGQPQGDQPSGLAPDELLDWFGDKSAFDTAVSLHTSLSRFEESHVHKFLSLRGFDERHEKYAVAFNAVQAVTANEALKVADDFVQALLREGRSRR